MVKNADKSSNAVVLQILFPLPLLILSIGNMPKHLKIGVTVTMVTVMDKSVAIIMVIVDKVIGSRAAAACNGINRQAECVAWNYQSYQW